MIVDIFETDKKYDVIYADPPWKYDDRLAMKGVSGMIRGAESFYNTMSLQEIKELPIAEISSRNAILFMWITMPFLDKAFEVMNAWGFKYKTCGFCWIKKTKTGKNHLGMGHYTRGNAELCLIGIKNKRPELQTRGMSQVVESEIRKHSQKPDEVREKIVELCGDIPRIELFARGQFDGWDAWGLEAQGGKNHTPVPDNF